MLMPVLKHQRRTQTKTSAVWMCFLPQTSGCAKNKHLNCCHFNPNTDGTAVLVDKLYRQKQLTKTGHKLKEEAFDTETRPKHPPTPGPRAPPTSTEDDDSQKQGHVAVV